MSTHGVERPEGSEEADVFGQVGQYPYVVFAHAQHPYEAENDQPQHSENDYEDQEAGGSHAQIIYAQSAINNMYALGTSQLFFM